MSVEGKRAPDFNLTACEDGVRTKMSRIAGRGAAVVVLVYASEAIECHYALQQLEDFAMTHSGVRCIVLNTADSAEVAQDFLADKDITTCESFTGPVPEKYGARPDVYPFHIVIDRAGMVVKATEDTIDLSAIFDDSAKTL